MSFRPESTVRSQLFANYYSYSLFRPIRTRYHSFRRKSWKKNRNAKVSNTFQAHAHAYFIKIQQIHQINCLTSVMKKHFIFDLLHFTIQFRMKVNYFKQFPDLVIFNVRHKQSTQQKISHKLSDTYISENGMTDLKKEQHMNTITNFEDLKIYFTSKIWISMKR